MEMEKDDDEDRVVKIVFHKDTELLLSDGTSKKTIDIQENDILLGTHDTNIVVNKYFAKENLYRIITRYGNGFIIGENTQFLTYNNSSRVFEQIDIKQYSLLNNEQKKSFSIYKTVVEFQDEELNIDPYFLGLFLGNTNKLFVKIKYNDDIFLKDMILESIKTLKFKTFISENEITILISDILIDNDIKILYHFMFYSKFIPDNYKKNSINFRRQILAGIIDINSVEKSNYIEIRKLEKKIALDICNICFSIGIFHIMLIKEKEHFNIKIFDDISRIPLIKKFIPKQYMCNNFKVATIVENDCVVLEFKKLNSLILSDFTVV